MINDFKMEDKQEFMLTCFAKRIPVTPTFVRPKTVFRGEVKETTSLRNFGSRQIMRSDDAYRSKG